MRYRLWEVRQEQFDALVDELGFTGRMKDALTSRYRDQCAYPRSLVCETHDVTEHGLMKAEKKILRAHEKFTEVYGGKITK